MGGGADYSMTHRFTIDYAEDYHFIRAVFDELYPADPLFGVGDILGLLERRHDIYAMNAGFAGVNWYRHHLDELTTMVRDQTRAEAGGGARAVTAEQKRYTMTNKQSAELQSTALRVREHIIRLSAGGGCFIGASLSCVEIMVYLYTHVIRRNADEPNDPQRDYLFLSKGHDVPALYGTFVEMGWLETGGFRIICPRRTVFTGILTGISPGLNFIPVRWDIFPR
jgi:hypothetical protein